MRRSPVALVLLLAMSTVSQAGKDSDALKQFGLIGTWAFDCRKPPAPANPFMDFTPSAAGQPTRQTITGDPRYDGLVTIKDAALLDAAHLRLSYPQGAVRVTVTLVKEQQHIRPYEATASDGTVSVSGGVVKATGRPTRWLVKCPD